MKATFDNLKKLETKIHSSITNCRNGNYLKWHESKTRINYQTKWEKMMEELRGWSDFQGDLQTKPEWLEYCTKEGLNPSYNFGDILA